MKFSLILLALLSTSALAFEIKSVKVENNVVTFPAQHDLSEGNEIYVYSRGEDKKLSHVAILKITRCDLDECDAKVLKIKKGAQLFTNSYYSTKNLKTGAPGGGSNRKNLLFVTYGGPLTRGYNFGFLREINNNLKAGLKAGLIDATIGKVGVEGRYFALQADFKFTNIASIDVNPYGEVGYLQTTLDFAKINGPEFDENVPYVGLGLNLWKTWSSFSLLVKGGYAHNFYKATYSDDIADYSLPFSGGLIVFEVGAGLTF